MDTNKVGNFIKQLRQSKKLSQEELANQLMCDRTKVNKFEKGTRTPTIDDFILLSQIFDVSLEEIILGEKENKNNKIKLKKVLNDYLKNQNTKAKKIRTILVILLIIFILSFFTITTLYFINNYKSVRVYRLSSESSNFVITDGLLILSKDKMYFNIGFIEPSVEEIEIYSEMNGKNRLIYKGSPYVVLNDRYGYDSLISYEEFIKSKEKIYVIINNEKMYLNFEEDFTNDKLYYEKEQIIGEEEVSKEYNIPDKVKELFECEDDSCSLTTDNSNIIFNSNTLIVSSGDEYYCYDLNELVLHYEDTKENFTVKIDADNIICKSGNCKNSKEIYNNFYNNYIKKYLLN